tara:strand:+ start:661 stop:906 length:246 start_codon:yes stop_codon:yes gene_type:complete
MANEKSIAVYENIIKTEKTKSITSLKLIKTDGTASGAEEAVKELQKSGATSFEVVDKNKGFKTLYNKTLGGRNYETKVVKV